MTRPGPVFFEVNPLGNENTDQRVPGAMFMGILKMGGSRTRLVKYHLCRSIDMGRALKPYLDLPCRYWFLPVDVQSSMNSTSRFAYLPKGNSPDQLPDQVRQDPLAPSYGLCCCTQLLMRILWYPVGYGIRAENRNLSSANLNGLPPKIPALSEAFLCEFELSSSRGWIHPP
jgi:hypothetical protein